MRASPILQIVWYQHFCHVALIIYSCEKGEAKVKVKTAYEPSGPLVLEHEATRSISTPPGWDASPSQGYPQQ